MEHLIQHFRKDEQPFIEQVVGWQREVEDRYAPKLTDFLDPRQRFIVMSVIGQSDDLAVYAQGIFEQPERMRVMIAPSYFMPAEEDYQITVFSINYPSKFVQLRHPDVLGALLSVGMERSKFGDIRVAENTVQFAVATEVADYVRAHLTSIGKVKVHLEEIGTQPLLRLEEEWVESTTTVSSMRLDVVLATVLNISRQKSQNLITAGRVKVNWTVREQVSFELQEGDILSARGFGRLKVIMTEGRTKKDKIRLQIGRLEQKQ
ncbi:RNA-binding protein [Lysinibacillus odysseyi]|uniref:RNA-binding protein S4 n=1 Tax=Lysinibacillus odysseyi 34hs-1 = NBRC 100172 TaxID=1220589 RepID=A0A0A3IXJ9_9BACI|nr:RNA-binding protein [Lysinibacillus odysseyi]KGR87618.1 RNA-binding protein S4 [Lysinibacillus odysseyi 34hs-1 = NBRC 100172]